MGLQIYELFFIYQQKTCFSALWAVDNSRLPPSRHPIQVRPARHAYLLVTIGPLVTPDLIRLLVMPDSISPLVMPYSIGHLPCRPRNRKCNHRVCDRQAEFGAFLCLTVPKTRVLSPKTGPTGKVSCKTLPDGREHGILWRKYRNCQGNFYTFAHDFMAFRERCGE